MRSCKQIRCLFCKDCSALYNYYGIIKDFSKHSDNVFLTPFQISEILYTLREIKAIKACAQKFKLLENFVAVTLRCLRNSIIRQKYCWTRCMPAFGWCATGFLKLLLSVMCVCVSTSRLLIISDTIWCDIVIG